MMVIPSHQTAIEKENAMNLRNTTVWTTGAMMVGTIICPIVFPPFAISWLVARRLKFTIPLLVLLFPVMICGFLCVDNWYSWIFHNGHGMEFASIFTFLFMPPFWIIAVLLNRYYTKQSEPQS